MDSNTENEIPILTRKFGYSEIVWEIENYLSATCSKHWIIDSPEFIVRGSQVTKWRLTLKPKYLKETYTVSVYIERVESDSFPKPVRLRWKILYTADEFEHIVSEKLGIFPWKSKYGLEIKNIEAIEDKMRKTSYDKFRIRCTMIVYDMDGVRFNPPADSGLKSLSQDMAVLYRLNKKFDIILLMGEVIRAHKSVLCARNKVLSSEIDRKVEELTFDYAWVEGEAAKDLIAFLYTGNVEYVLRTPSFSMQILIDYFMIKELKGYFVKDEVTIRTSFDVQEIQANWIIPKMFITIDEVVSDTWELGIGDASFRLNLLMDREETFPNGTVEEKSENQVSVIKFPAPVSYAKKSSKTAKEQHQNVSAKNDAPKRKRVQDMQLDEILKEKNQNEQSQEEKNKEKVDQESVSEKQNISPEKCKNGSNLKEETNDVLEETHYVSIYVEFLTGEPPKEVFLTCAVYNLDDEFEVINGARWNSSSGKKLGIDKFFPRKLLNDPLFLKKDQLSIVTKLRIPTGVKRHSLIKSKIFSIDYDNSDYHYLKLSKNLGELLHSGDFSDLVVASRVIRFKVHKAILSTRSHVLAKILKDLKEDSLTIQDVDAQTLRTVLQYIYTGTLKDYKPEEVKQIYKVAAKFGLLSLKNTCSRLLQDDVNLQNALEVLVLAHEKSDLKLKSSALKFICRNIDEVQSRANWDTFLDANPNLSSELVKFKETYIDLKKKIN